MTIKVTVTNSDTRDTATIAVQVQTKDVDLIGIRPADHLLKAGESVEMYVHSGQNLLIKEVSQ